jgi:hypothetical protein
MARSTADQHAVQAVRHRHTETGYAGQVNVGAVQQNMAQAAGTARTHAAPAPEDGDEHGTSLGKT